MTEEDEEAAIARFKAARPRLERANPQGVKLETHINGPDIVAERGGCGWAIECKPAGDGRPSTLDETVIRGLGKIVKYFDPRPYKNFRTGLALPDHPLYGARLAALSPPAREVLRLYIILVNESGVRCFAPGESIDSMRPSRRSKYD